MNPGISPTEIEHEKLNFDKITLEESDEFYNIYIYPNPTDGLLTVELTSEKNVNAKVTIYNIHGQELGLIGTGMTSKNKFEFELREQSGGIYFVRILTKQQIINKRVVLIK